MLEVRFISSNEFKIAEAKGILYRSSIDVVPISLKIEELQTEDTHALVKDKAIKAFRSVGRSLFVEHTGLYLPYLNGLPGGLTQIFWDKLQADKFSEMFGKSGANTVIARTVIGYIDGKNFHLFTGEVEGVITSSPRGSRSFQWDCVFMPLGFDKTFAEMGPKKDEVSMRRKALDALSTYLFQNVPS